MNETTSQSGAALASAGRLAWIAFIVAVLVGGVNAVAVRFTVAELPPFWGATLRFGLAAALFWVASRARRESFPRGRELQGVLLYGILNFGLGYAFLYVGIIELGAGLTQVVLALGPLITFFLALAHRLETFQWRPLIGALLAVGGIAMAFAQRPEGNLPLLSLLYIVAGTAAFSESIIVIKKYPPAPMLMTNALAAT
ncbi:MAG TPA: DMT family transporter, partial [Promineifilum sp.]